MINIIDYKINLRTMYLFTLMKFILLKIDKGYVNLIIFDDLVFSNKKISEFHCKSRKLNCTCIFIGHRYFNNISMTYLSYIQKRTLII